MIGGTDPNEGGTLTQANADIMSALRTLQQVGAADKADSILSDVETSRSYADLDSDREHNTDWLTTEYARRYISVMTDLARQLTRVASGSTTQDQDDAARCFGVKGLPGDVASLAISRRDAGDRVANTDPARLCELLATAARNGDDVLAHAILEVGVATGLADVVDDFKEAYPSLADAVDRLWTAAHRKTNVVDITNSWRVAALKPRQLSSLQDYEIQAAAAGNTGVGRWSVGQ
ncbi:hypothetical protein [Mycolicibacterium sp.]|uniref:hypothetical protein n=1 Tax=Mycolicibacterium sp. TaxID=2320850 RepID=UPI0037C8C85C